MWNAIEYNYDYNCLKNCNLLQSITIASVLLYRRINAAFHFTPVKTRRSSF